MAPGRWGTVDRDGHFLGNMQDVGGEIKDNHAAVGQEFEDSESLSCFPDHVRGSAVGHLNRSGHLGQRSGNGMDAVI
jgi:hypothetical protein